jgi:hypothetical protein
MDREASVPQIRGTPTPTLTKITTLNETNMPGKLSTVRYGTINECYNEEFLSIKSECYNERGGILSTDVAHACS